MGQNYDGTIFSYDEERNLSDSTRKTYDFLFRIDYSTFSLDPLVLKDISNMIFNGKINADMDVRNRRENVITSMSNSIEKCINNVKRDSRMSNIQKAASLSTIEKNIDAIIDYFSSPGVERNYGRPLTDPLKNRLKELKERVINLKNGKENINYAKSDTMYHVERDLDNYEKLKSEYDKKGALGKAIFIISGKKKRMDHLRNKSWNDYEYEAMPYRYGNFNSSTNIVNESNGENYEFGAGSSSERRSWHR